MTRRWLAALIALGFGAASAPKGRCDEFDRLEGTSLAHIPAKKDATRRQRLTFGEIESLPNLLRDTRSALVVATTDQGNLVRMLVVPGLRKSPKAAKPVPVVVLERFDTFESGNLSTRLARGKDLMLFDGFELDLDSGQVVPEGQGGDIQFLAKGEGGPRLLALSGTTLYTLSKLPEAPDQTASKPTLGRSVQPSDFAGRYRLFANGQWSGVLDLKVDQEGTVSGRFRSDLNGTAYPVNGKVANDVPQKLSFTIKYPRTRQEFEGLLWTEGKGAMAGTLTMLEHAYGFFAIREGGKIGPEGDDLGTLGKSVDAAGRRTVAFGKGEYTLDGKAQTDQELTESLKKSLAIEPATWVLLQVPENEPYSEIQKAVAVIGAAGIERIRLAPADAH